MSRVFKLGVSESTALGIPVDEFPTYRLGPLVRDTLPRGCGEPAAADSFRSWLLDATLFELVLLSAGVFSAGIVAALVP